MPKASAVKPMSVFLVVVAISAASCDKKMKNPSGPSPVSPSSQAPVSLRIEGATTLTGPGQTQQLVAIATYANGDEQSVSSNVTWTSSRTGVATVTSGGQAPGTVTAVGLGATTIRASLSPDLRPSQVLVMVTPPGTFAVGGRVREPGAGDLTGVLIEENGGINQTTSNKGDFTLGGLTSGQLHFTMAGYETVDQAAVAGDSLDVPMQRILVLATGATLNSLLAPNDLSYEVRPGVYCQPCRRVRVTSNAAGTVDLHLAWSVAGAALHLWINGQGLGPSDPAATGLDASLAVQTGEQFIYVGGGGTYLHVPWSLKASDVR
jgi:hypothetical protein